MEDVQFTHKHQATTKLVFSSKKSLLRAFEMGF